MFRRLYRSITDFLGRVGSSIKYLFGRNLDNSDNSKDVSFSKQAKTDTILENSYNSYQLDREDRRSDAKNHESVSYQDNYKVPLKSKKPIRTPFFTKYSSETPSGYRLVTYNVPKIYDEARKHFEGAVALHDSIVELLRIHPETSSSAGELAATFVGASVGALISTSPEALKHENRYARPGSLYILATDNSAIQFPHQHPGQRRVTGVSGKQGGSIFIEVGKDENGKVVLQENCLPPYTMFTVHIPAWAVHYFKNVAAISAHCTDFKEIQDMQYSIGKSQLTHEDLQHLIEYLTVRYPDKHLSSKVVVNRIEPSEFLPDLLRELEHKGETGVRKTGSSSPRLNTVIYSSILDNGGMGYDTYLNVRQSLLQSADKGFTLTFVDGKEGKKLEPMFESVSNFVYAKLSDAGFDSLQVMSSSQDEDVGRDMGSYFVCSPLDPAMLQYKTRSRPCMMTLFSGNSGGVFYIGDKLSPDEQYLVTPIRIPPDSVVTLQVPADVCYALKGKLAGLAFTSSDREQAKESGRDINSNELFTDLERRVDERSVQKASSEPIHIQSAKTIMQDRYINVCPRTSVQASMTNASCQPSFSSMAAR